MRPVADVVEAVALAAIMRDPCWLTHAFCPHPPVSWGDETGAEGGSIR